MINLLPSNFKQDVSYARRNTTLTSARDRRLAAHVRGLTGRPDFGLGLVQRG